MGCARVPAMVALPAVPKVVKVVLYNLLLDAAAYMLNRVFMQYSGTAPTDTELETYAGAVNTAYGSNLIPLQGPGVTYGGCGAEDLSSSTSAVGSSADTVVGTRSGATLGGQVCFIISGEIARRYRGGHPRSYWPFGIDTDSYDAHSWHPTFLTSVLTAWGDFLTAIEGAGWTGAGTLSPVNVSYYEGFTNHTYPSGRTRPIPTLRGTPVVDPIISYVPRPDYGTQRRRVEYQA